MKPLNRALVGFAALVITTATALAADEPEDRVLGDADAPVTIIEYASLSCPHCAAFHARVLPWLKENYIETGQVKLVFRDFPLNGPALWGSMIAHCAKPERYFALIDLLFTKQRDWAFAPDPQAELAGLARLSGMGRSTFDQCMANESLQERILQTRLDGQKKYDIKSTPSFIITGELVSGALTQERLTKLIAEAGS